jgi:hypothetical protein
MKIEAELVQKLKEKVFKTENDKLLVESFEIEREKQLTPVEWLYEQLPGHIRVSKNGLDMLKQAKEKEKGRLEDAYRTGIWDVGCRSTSFKEYYNRTFKQQQEQ